MGNTTYRFMDNFGKNPILVIRNGQLVFKDFEGKITKFNKHGDKSFCVVIDDHAFARTLANEGWNVKQFKPRDDEDGEPDYYINVKVSFDSRFPPEVAILNDDGTLAPLTEESVSVLDHSYISTADISINAHHWTDDEGNEKVKGYLRKMHVRLNSTADEFADEPSEALPF